MHTSPDAVTSPPDDTPPPLITHKVEGGIAALCMAAVTLITFANVVVRYLTDVSLAITEEFAIFLMLAMTLFGASAAAARGHNIRVGIMVDRFPPGLRRVTTVIIDLLSAGTFIALAVLSTLYTYDIWEFEDVSPGLGWPMWLYWMWVPLVSALIALRILGRSWRVNRRTGP